MKTLKREPNYKELTEIMNEVLRTGETVIIDTATKYSKISRIDAPKERGGNYVSSETITLRTRQGKKYWMSMSTGEFFSSSKKESKELAGL